MLQQNIPVELSRPSSVGSSHSSTCFVQNYKGSKNRGKNDICVGEELKIAVDIALERFRLSEEQKQLEFPSSLTSLERAYIHQLSQPLGFKTKSKGHGANRALTVYKKEDVNTSIDVMTLDLMRNSRHQIHTLNQRYPVTNREKQELLPRTERGQHNDGGVAKEMSKATTGRLNNGVAQVPPPRAASDLTAFVQTLPVMKQGDSIRKMIADNQVMMVSGETGSGKTTQIPQMILDDCHEENRPCRIFCTQPRRIAALSVAERVASERGEKVGQTVGYQIRLESRVSPRTVLTFCTNGVLLRTLMGADNTIASVTHILVDEIHERDRFSDFLLIALRDALPKYRNLKIILMSASFNTQLFCNYFGGCPMVQVPGSLFSVQNFFLEDILQSTGYMNDEMKKYKSSIDSVVNQTKKLDIWYEQQSQGVEDEEDEVVVEGEEVISLTRTEFTDDSEGVLQCDNGHVEKAEVEACLVEEMDNLLTEAWMSGKEEPLHKLLNLMMTENVSIDYMHSETSATVLMVTAGRGYFVLVEQILQLGANASLRSSNEWTAVDWAHHFQHTDIVELLEAHIASSEMVQSNESVLLQQAAELDGEQRHLLQVYHHTYTEEKVNLQLVLCLIHQIHSSQKDGAVLVFLPGYDDIVCLRDLILSDKRFLDSNRYTVYTLHSQMQTGDQRKVFKPPPPGIRKIILATNIAETSITINDVVFVIDAGKVKVKAFDAITSASSLKEQWISQASALQRRGRAGRCQGGECYRLYSSIRYKSMAEFQQPELLRYPLQELCLHAKLLTPVNCRIADYLAKAPEPPAFLLTRNAVHILKQMDALDGFEDLTEVGLHLADLPIDPKYGKMILYSVVLKCLDPVLTISCAMAYKDPFMLPPLPSMKRAAVKSRRKYAADTYSDHMALLRAFQAWQKAKTEGWERSFCEQNFLSSPTMEMIVGMRTQLLGQLRASGFVRARGGGDIRDLNTNSENWAVVKGALLAGLYPNLIKVDRTTNALTTIKENRVRFHATTTVGPENTSVSGLKKFIQQLPTDWLVYEEMTRLHRIAQVRCCTLISPVTVALFAGPAKLPVNQVREAECGSSHEAVRSMGGHQLMDGESSDSETDNKDDTKTASYRPDDWVHFNPDPEASSLLMHLRQKWHSLFLRRMRAPAKSWSQMDEAVIRAVVQVLTNEEQALGLQQPAGIGQRPRPMSTESCVSSGGSRRGSVDTEQSDDSSTSGEVQRYNTTRQQAPRPFKVHTTPPRKRDLRLGGDAERSDTSSAPSSGSASGSGSGANSLRGSAASSPCASPHSATTSPSPGTSGGQTQTAYYVVMKANNHRLLDISQQKLLWATSTANEKKLNKAFLDGRKVMLIFSVQGSGHFQGYAQMVSPSGQAERIKDFIGQGMGATFSIQWGKRANLPFQHCHHLLNPWNENRKVQVSRDGQEIEPVVGQSLLKLWDNIQPFQPRNPTSVPPQRAGYNAAMGRAPSAYDMGRRGGPGGDWRGPSPQWGAQPQFPAGFQNKNFGQHSPGMGRSMGGASPYNAMYLPQQMMGGGGAGGHYMSPKGSPGQVSSHGDMHSMSPVMILQRGGNHGNPSSPTPGSAAGSQPGSYYAPNNKH